jgi:hypothetical protein
MPDESSPRSVQEGVKKGSIFRLTAWKSPNFEKTSSSNPIKINQLAEDRQLIANWRAVN